MCLDNLIFLGYNAYHLEHESALLAKLIVRKFFRILLIILLLFLLKNNYVNLMFELTIEDEERLTYEKRLEEAEERERSFEEVEEDY